MSEKSRQKQLTVSFRDVTVQVAGVTESYASTVASVAAKLIPSFGRNGAPARVSCSFKHFESTLLTGLV